MRVKELSRNVALITALFATSASASDLGVINVDSTTIDDRFESKATEVSNVSTIKGETVDKAHVENIQQVLKKIPGLTTEVQSGDSLKLHIRGVENQRYMGEKPGVAVVIDGVPVFERTGRVNIDLDNIENIKVIKGGASYLFGEDALAGAVVITTKKGAKYDNTKIDLEKGSYGYKKGLVRTGYANEDLNFHVQASQRESDGYWEDSDYETRYVNGKLQYYLDMYSDITVGFEDSNREKDSHGTVKGLTQAEINPESIDDGTGDNRDYTRHYDVDLVKVYATYSRDFDSGMNLLANVYRYTDETDFVSAPQKYDAAGNPVTNDEAYTTKNEYEQKQQGFKSELRIPTEKFGAMVGLDLRANQYENLEKYRVDFKTSPFSPTVYNAGTVTQNDKTDEDMQAVYGELKYQLSDALVATANARYDQISYDYKDYLNTLALDKNFYVDSYRLGLTYALGDTHSLYTNISTGFRTPTISQLFAGTISPTGSTLNNTALKPEESLNYEIGLRGYTQELAANFEYDVAIFQIDRDDYIMSSIGQYAKAGSGTTSRYENIGDVRNRGLELSLGSQLSQTVRMDLAYTYLDAEFKKYDNFTLGLGNPYSPAPGAYTTTSYNLAGNTVPRTSEHTINLSMDISPVQNLTISPELFAQSSYYADEMNRFRMPGYATLNLLTSYTYKIGGFDVDFFARVDNLLDKRYFNTARSHGDTNYDGSYDQEDISLVVNPGRTFTAGLSMTF